MKLKSLILSIPERMNLKWLILLIIVFGLAVFSATMTSIDLPPTHPVLEFFENNTMLIAFALVGLTVAYVADRMRKIEPLPEFSSMIIKSMIKHCPTCGKELLPDRKFCSQCRREIKWFE